MGRLRTLTILLTLGAWGAATDGAPPDDAAATARAPLPKGVRAGDYVKAAGSLLKKGDADTAAKYLKAANDYRDLLAPQEQAALDQYNAALSAGQPKADAAVAPAAAPSPAPAAVVGATPSPSAPPPAAAAPPAEAAPIGPMGRGGVNGDVKQTARWLLAAGREQLRQGNLDEAEAKLSEARSLNVRWGLFELDTPTKLAEALAKARAQAPKVAAAGTAGDKRQARARLKQARDLLDAGQHDQAFGIAQEVAAWNLSYSLLEDSPRKVAAAARAMGQRDKARRDPTRVEPSQGAYDVLIQEARQLMAAGQLGEAEARARQAMGLGVTPPLTADRAENVLHDVQMARTRAGGAADPAVAQAGARVVAPSPSAAAEQEGNALLAQGRVEEAKAKFAQAKQFQDREIGLAAVAPADAAPGAADAAPQPIDAAPQPIDAAPQPIDAQPAIEPAQPADAAAAPAPEPSGNGGAALLDQARTLLTGGNFAAAKQAAQQARDGGFGLDAQANELLAQIALAEQQGSLTLYEAALDSVRKGDVLHARQLLTEMAAADLDESMAQKVQDLLMKLPKDAAGKAVVGATETDQEVVAAQKLNAEVGARMGDARRLMETDPEKAIALLQETLESVKAANLSPAVAKTMNRRVEVALELARKDKVDFDRKMQDKAGREEIERKRLRILEADKAKKQQLAELLGKARDAMNEHRYGDAEMLATRAAAIDPNEVAATAMANLARIRRHYETALSTRDAKNESNLLAWESVDKTGIVDRDVIERDIAHRPDWADLTRSRKELAQRLQGKVPNDPKVQAILGKLDDPITLNIEKQPLGDALDFLRNYTGLNIVPDMQSLAEEGLTLQSPVTLQVKDVKIKHALKLLLTPLHLSYTVDNEVLMITSPNSNRAKLITRAYDVADLVVPVRDRQNPATSGQPYQALNPDGTPGAPATGQGATPAGPTGGQTVTAGGLVSVTPEMFVPLMQLVKATVAPGSWKNDDGLTPAGYGLGAGLGGGGGADADQNPPVGSITPFFLNISLIIRHTAEVHDEVVDLLRQLRRLQDLQVSIEVRFITVNDSFFEQIGVQFDFNIQSDVAGRKNAFAAVNPLVAIPGGGGNGTGGTGGTGGGTGTGGTAVSPILINPYRDHSLGNKQPVTVGTTNGQVGNFTSDLGIPFLQSSAGAITPFNALTSNVGATFGIAFLSDLELYLFITAVQGDQRSNIVQAPKVTTFNGAGATIINFTQRNYVAALIPIVANGAVAFQPTISSIPDGVQLFVTPVVSADRRYVRMTLSPFFFTFIQFDTFTIPAAVSGFLGGSGIINAQIQLPVFSLTNVSTTVTVPDGGTVLLGGVKRLREERKEFGVPILAKTPLIDRLFRNIGIGRTTDSLMLMVTPRIIILEEEEERLGVPTVQNFNF